MITITPTVEMRQHQLQKAVSTARSARAAYHQTLATDPSVWDNETWESLTNWAADTQLAVDRERDWLETSLRAANPNANEHDLTAALERLGAAWPHETVMGAESLTDTTNRIPAMDTTEEAA